MLRVVVAQAASAEVSAPPSAAGSRPHSGGGGMGGLAMGGLAMAAAMDKAVGGHFGFGGPAPTASPTERRGEDAASESGSASTASTTSTARKRPQYAGVYWCKRGSGGAVLVHGEGIYRHRDGLKKAGGVFDGILHGWVFTPGPGMRWDTYGKIVAMLEEKFEAVQRDRMRSFIEPPKPIPVKLAHDCCRLSLPVVDRQTTEQKEDSSLLSDRAVV